MKERIHAHSAVIRSDDGIPYDVTTWGEERGDGTWKGWLEFRPHPGRGTTLRTGRETTQPNRNALEYWASGLEDVYLEGAFVRALERRGQLTRS